MTLAATLTPSMFSDASHGADLTRSVQCLRFGSAYSFTVGAGEISGALGNSLDGVHIVFCSPFFNLNSLRDIPQQHVGSDMAVVDNDDVIALEKTQPGEMLHELAHQVLTGVPGLGEPFRRMVK